MYDSRSIDKLNAPARLEPDEGVRTEGMSFDARETVPRFTFREWREVFSMMRDQRYRETPLGPDVVIYLRWKRLAQGSERTLDQYERDLRLICMAVGCDVTGVDYPDLMLILDLVPPKSHKRVRAAWNDFFRWAIREGRRPDNPVDRLPKLQSTGDPVYTNELLTPAEIERLIAATTTMEHPRIERLRLQTMIETGGRAAELRGLRLHDFDLYGKTVTVTGKKGKTRVIPIGPDLSRLVDEYLLTPYPEPCGRDPLPTDYLWFPIARRCGKITSLRPQSPLGYGSWRRWWLRMEQTAKVRHRKAHMTRHTFATDILDATGDVHAAKELLGHASVRTTEVYLHSSRSGAKRSAVDAVRAYREGALS